MPDQPISRHAPRPGLPPGRRGALRAVLCLLTAAWARTNRAAPSGPPAPGVPAGAGAPDAGTRPEPPTPAGGGSLLRLTDGVYILPGAVAAPDATNAGRVGNLGFVVGSEGVALIDTGSSRARAVELLAAVRSVTDLPVRTVLVTHPAQEFLFGASLFLDAGIPVMAHPQTPKLMAARCQHCLDTLTHDLGAARMAGTRLALPAALTLPAAPVDLGGRSLEIIPGPSGTVPGNLMVRERSTGVLFTGALLSIGRIPGVQDTRPPDWQLALAALTRPLPSAVVPAYGPVAWATPRPGQMGIHEAQAALAGYFADLEAQARALYAAATPLAELSSHAELPRYRDWNGYPATHLHNIFYRYLQLEAEDLASH